jgi:hypothetical protein
MKTVLVCIAKDEENYVEEWLDYNHKLGFDEIIMYENDWKCPVERPFLNKIKFPGLHQQMNAYNHFLKHFRDDYDWIAFLDIDEFLVLKKHNNLKEFLTEHDNEFGVSVNWYFFGSNGQVDRQEENKNSLLKQFTKRGKDVDQLIKTILKSSSGGWMQLPHNPNTPLMDTNGKVFQGPWNPQGPTDVAQINHYHHKSFEDWLIRCKRGQSDHCPTKEPKQWEDEKTLFNDVDDFTARDFMYKNN